MSLSDASLGTGGRGMARVELPTRTKDTNGL
jgi:hypothetical protein